MYEAGGAQRQIAIAQTALGWMVLQQVWSGWSAGRITGDSGRGFRWMSYGVLAIRVIRYWLLAILGLSGL